MPETEYVIQEEKFLPIKYVDQLAQGNSSQSVHKSSATSFSPTQSPVYAIFQTYLCAQH